MSQLTQALEVVKDLSQMKSRLMKAEAELNSILKKTVSDGSIQPGLTAIRLQEIETRLKALVQSIDSFTFQKD